MSPIQTFIILLVSVCTFYGLIIWFLLKASVYFHKMDEKLGNTERAERIPYNDDTIVPGEKGQTTTYGTHVPLILYWPDHIMPGIKTSQLVNFTDFMPTLANIAGIPVPTTYGKLDGKTFYPILTGSTSSLRNYIFNHFQPDITSTSNKLIRYVQNRKYKLYENGKFYNIISDVEEITAIPSDQTKNDFTEILNRVHN